MVGSQRQKEGEKAGYVCMVVNFFLFVGKLVAGLATNSIAIIADSFNNLGDCGTNLATVAGFRLGAKKGDSGHPYGHGRMEYVAGFIVSVVILLTAFFAGQAAINRIISPEPISFSWMAVIFCIIAIFAKIGMAIYLKHANRSVESETINASLWDSVTDTLVTIIALISLIMSPMFDFPLDGILGIIVSLFILGAGIKIASNNVLLILGPGLSQKEHYEVHDFLKTYPIFTEIDKLYLHDYGPEERILIVKVQLSADHHTLAFEKALEKCKRDTKKRFGFHEVIFFWPPDVH